MPQEAVAQEQPAAEGSQPPPPAQPQAAASPPASPLPGQKQSKHKRAANYLVAFLFGILVPAVLIFSAYQSVKQVESNLVMDGSLTPRSILADAKDKITTGNDYVLLTWIYGEYANEKTLVNKQSMKTAIIHMGLAMVSIGLMLIILGINDGGGEGKLGVGDFSFDFKTGSTGALVLVMGAAMAGVAGISQNQFVSGTLPTYQAGPINSTSSPNIPSQAANKDVQNYNSCKYGKDNKYNEDYPSCFLGSFEELHKGELK